MMSVVQLDDYEYVKDFILNQFKLTPRQYKARFDQAEKRFDETFIMFAARLRNNFRYYLRSRDVIDDFERLCELIISDKLRCRKGHLITFWHLKQDRGIRPTRSPNLQIVM